MVEVERSRQKKHPRIVGGFIRQRREGLGLSQKALGQRFSPPVTTQFISNVERGVTPLPPNHVGTIAQALGVPEGELMALLEREYTAKLSGRIGTGSENGLHVVDAQMSNGHGSLKVDSRDLDFIRSVYEAYRSGSDQERDAFRSICESVLKIKKVV